MKFIRNTIAYKRQQGMSLIAALMLVILIGTLVLFVVRAIPVYIEYFSIVKSVESLKSLPKIESDDPEVIRKTLQESLLKQLQANNINSVRAEQISIDIKSNGYQVLIHYDAQVPFIANIDLLMHFDKTIMVPKNES